ncbi:hypothetical protein SPRG_14036 [Saprolegnia parasitica CBS 223.65]|uniref:Secreted protein n=1 Tax=Saprolegnia parasitica (strain CBS 223.65) TaxID=695850 RepID=A0A067BVR9_SAPPC|nr:hypothetical protein SPRG_14036 [Saprolegnia parasitica CBS 223.65]KDO20945.1 hypothetical protein SPRG_14036 [Saprolegnia parasitica CBS 223.65]|eukprot:XP_012208337.1 hypothetical protein SPRG_14036 [Saprolegnia parasitica CBS 223.65]
MPIKICVLATCASVAAAAMCTGSDFGSAYTSAIKEAVPSFLQCAEDVGISLEDITANKVDQATPAQVQKFAKSPSCAAAFKTIQKAFKAISPPCTMGTMCGKELTTAQFADMPYEDYLKAAAQGDKCTLPSASSAASTSNLGLVASGALVLYTML